MASKYSFTALSFLTRCLFESKLYAFTFLSREMHFLCPLMVMDISNGLLPFFRAFDGLQTKLISIIGVFNLLNINYTNNRRSQIFKPKWS